MSRTALIVTGEEDLASILTEPLRDSGFTATVLSMSHKALEWARLHTPSLILLDRALPENDGYHVCEALKLDRDTNLIPILLLTDLSENEERLAGLLVGADQYLVKPFTRTELCQAVQAALARQEELRRHSSRGAIRFHLPSDSPSLEDLNHLIGALGVYSGLPQSQVRQLTLAVHELGSNAIEWGHRKQRHRVLTVDYHCDASQVAITIKDGGAGFDPYNLPHAASLEDPVGHLMVRELLGLREGGFGILIARGLVDELTYNDRGNEVRLVKYFQALPPFPGAKERQEFHEICSCSP
jgi:CheY-like chemotaxis protein/anti-sigma regulatory factor (Ser/Thr protein kinase)